MKTAKSDNLDAIKTSDGTAVAANRTGSAAKGCTLANSTTYVFPLAPSESNMVGEKVIMSVHLQWAAAVAAVFTLEVSDFPAKTGGASNDIGADDVLDYSTTAGEWQQYNPPAAYVPVTGASNSAAAATVTAGGAAAGSAYFGLSDVGSRRIRIKAVVTTGGVVRCGFHAKEGV
jgi:hypothetical protein